MELISVRDPVHGRIVLSRAALKIIDTREFQRLRWLKHLGLLEFIYPTATYTAFSHAIGVAHLARLWAASFQKSQPELKISDVDVLCVEIASLCINLGLRPFSSCWTEILETVHADGGNERGFSEEEMSVLIFHLIYNSYDDVREAFEERGLGDGHRCFIEQLITGKEVDDRLGGPGKSSVLLDSKMFLSDIVRNGRNRIDAPTLDFAVRAGHTLGLDGGTIAVVRIIQESHVVQTHLGDGGCDDSGGQPREIIFREKVAPDIQELFHLLARIAVGTVERGPIVAIEKMFVDAIVAANSHHRIMISPDKSLTLTEAATTPDGLLRMTDSCVFDDIRDSCSTELAAARHLLRRIVVRDVYRTVGVLKPKDDEDVEDVLPQALRYERRLKELLNQTTTCLEDAVAVSGVSIKYGAVGSSPLDQVRFFPKSDPDTVLPAERSPKFLCPIKTVVNVYYVLCRDDDAVDDVRKAVEELKLSLKSGEVILCRKLDL